MIKKILELLCVYLIVQLSVYSFTAFISWKTNPGDWTVDERFFTVILGVVLGLGGIGAYIGFSDYEQNK